ncbi:hypothetical protein SYNTR_0635 [Candidatus Syntrophocurvum alkaliphilum]|uniref:MgtC/SapB/SrpB/YhiD N-terminal domain-containing protein n=1 Tax=Candidatus Syntrophocurvum alkaliphilum TaxID=2293317 RepID=A0A6I6DFL0_9FIRM|nr:MgtC/SapB family protein [Candidatus Syntrophocurvum alkaliphilum]QGT99228.1 hypothetical protein SYNTR_0635 [Candidatus Syntrophocurvum alkaliphilum]
MAVETLLFRILLASIIGFIVGIMNKKHYDTPTGIIFSLICIGACLITITSTEFYAIAGVIPWASDPARLSAQIISALGFLGTGFIWINEKKEEVKGISAAASLWLTAVLGMLIGAGLSNITVVAVFFIILIYWISSQIELWKNG